MSNGEIKAFGRFNALDLACIVIVAFCAIGFLLAKEGHAGVNEQIHGNQKIDINVYFSGVKSKDPDLFKVGEPSFLTIRNQPVDASMTITSVHRTPKMAAFLSLDGKKAVAYPDPSSPLASDIEVTVTTTADVAKDGFVVHGQKLKVGNQVELEAFKYRIQGVVCDITPSK